MTETDVLSCHARSESAATTEFIFYQSSHGNMGHSYSRRRVLGTVLAGTVVGLAGCSGDGGSDNGGADNDTNETEGETPENNEPTNETTNGTDENGSDNGTERDSDLPSEPAGVFGQFQFDAANTGRGPAASVPSNPSVDWQYPEGGGRTVVGPIYVDGVLYGAVGQENEDDFGVTQRFVALNATTGEVLHERVLSSTIRVQPVYSEGTLYILEGSTLRALSTGDRNEQWATPDALESTAELTLAGDTVYGYATKSGTGKVVRAFSTADGSMRWEQPTAFSGFTRESPVAADDSNVYVPGDTLQAVARADGTEQWSVSDRGPYVSAPTVVDGTVYVGTDGGRIVGYDAADGTETVSVSTATSFGFDRSLAYNDGLLFAKQSALDTETGELAWERDEETTSVPTAAGELFLAVQSAGRPFVAINRSDGSTAWRAGPQLQSGLQGGAQIFAVGPRVYAGYNGQIVALA
jgi:outer membrane protein assembly factor BamB